MVDSTLIVNLRESIQDDIICCMDGYDEEKIDQLCDIVVNHVNKLLENSMSNKRPSEIVYELVSFIYDKYDKCRIPDDPGQFQCVLIDWLLKNNIQLSSKENKNETLAGR